MDRRTELLTDNAEGIARAAGMLAAGGLVAFPTETVYGLGADARNGKAVAGVFAAKNRPSFNPLILHLADTEAARQIGHFGSVAERLAAAFWPGPLTLVVPLIDPDISDLVTAGNTTVALRVPANPTAHALLSAFGGPVAAPSANPSGKVSPTRADHVMSGLNGRIDAVLDGGTCSVGVESTIALPSDDHVALLRPGGLPAEDLEAAAGVPLLRGADPEKPNAPGQLASHYAPAASVRLGAEAARDREILLGFGDAPGAALNLSPAGDLREAAANLFHHLREMDRLANGRGIAVSPVPDHGLGLAINDRLARAAAPRD